MAKKINVNFSSLVGLKAELLRKQAEVNEAKVRTEFVDTVPQLNKKNRKRTVPENTEKNVNAKILVDPEDIVAHKKSKLMLEAKARLYKRLQKSKNNDEKFLVDFKNKLDESDEDFVDENICEKYPIKPEENWVEYQDCFGRTRKCLKEDLPYMQKKDNLIKSEIMKRNEINDEGNNEQYLIQQKEPEIEVMRRKWEEQTQKLTDKADIHYQDILFDEARTHGVGYYAFSQNEDERIKQQENLSNLRKETERKQKEINEVKQMKERMEQNRLKAARIRQRIRAGLPAEPTEEELIQEKLVNSITAADNIITDNDNNESMEKDKAVMDQKSDINEKTADDEKKIKDFEEFLNKKNHWHIMSQEEWIHTCRIKRIKEFAPIYDNFVSAGLYSTTYNMNKQLCEDNKIVDGAKTDNSQETKECSVNLQNCPKDRDASDFVIKDTDNSRQCDTKSLADYVAVNSNDSKECDLESRNATESILSSTMNSSNKTLLPEQTVSYPLSQHFGNYPSDACSHVKASKFEQYKLANDTHISSLVKNNDVPIIFTDNSNQVNTQNVQSRSMNEDSIVAGLKYLREKFEESRNE